MSCKELALSLGFVRSKVSANNDGLQAHNISDNIAIVSSVSNSADVVSSRRKGQCTFCLRTIALTSVGLLYKHGPSPGCPGSNQQPVSGSVATVPPSQPVSHHVNSSTSAFASTVTPTTTAHLNRQSLSSASDVLDVLRSRRCRTVKRIPKAARLHAAEKLSELIGDVCEQTDSVEKWTDLLLFGAVCMAVPGQRGGKRHQPSLGSKMIRTINEYPSEVPANPSSHSTNLHHRGQPSGSNLAARISSKLEDGDVRGAVRLAVSDETIAPCNVDTLGVLRLLHPPRLSSTSHSPSALSTMQSDVPTSCLVVSESAVLAAVKSFAPGSAAGLDCLRPQHLKDMLALNIGDAGRKLLCRLTEFVNLCLAGRIPNALKPVFCGASLCALNKKGGGVRPIAVGCTLRRLCAKVACKVVIGKAAALFSPYQLGVGVPRATEAAVHAARRFVAGLGPGEGLLKLDFSNAFNCIRRDVILHCVAELFPELYAFVSVCYSDSAFLCFGDFLLMSDEGAQQGDPLGPLLFSLSMLSMAKSLSSEFNVWYLDDGSIGGNVDVLIQDFERVKQLSEVLGLSINVTKCEIISDDVNVFDRFVKIAPGILCVKTCDAVLLGAPIGDIASVTSILIRKLEYMKQLERRLSLLSSHDAFYLLRNCLNVPKILYVLRCSPCFSSSVLFEFEVVLRRTLESVLNVHLNDDAWRQATLPISFGGLGIRLPADLALPAFISSVVGSASLSDSLLPKRFCDRIDFAQIDAITLWGRQSSLPCPDSQFASAQKAWDLPLVRQNYEVMLSAAQSPAGRARLLAAASPHSGDFLAALPASALGTRLDDSSFRIAVALRLGAPVCAPHTCVCGQEVDTFGTHGLSCRRSAGRHSRHTAVNELIKRALASADVPARLEPSSLTRSDGKRPDGITLVPWSTGRCLVWDFTCPDSLASSHLHRAVIGPGVVANDSESRKKSKYSNLSALYQFVPVAVETLGALGEDATALLKDIGRRIAAVTFEPRSTQFLLQRLSIAIQRGNAACVMGTAVADCEFDDIFLL
jgi:Reverse transcriptase (RNA-dependent DNA polymerase)